MNYLTLFSAQNLALLSDWLRETGELYVDVYVPHSDGSSLSYFVSTIEDLKALIAQQNTPELLVTIFHHLQFPLRGVAADALLQVALEYIPDGEWYTIVSLDHAYPAATILLGSGSTHEQLQADFERVQGANVAIGQNPFDIRKEADWLRTHPEEVFEVSVLKGNQYAVVKNRDY
ncbi:MAG: hypothetical protein GC204_21040 [Chloroflexi bacterium]|nr:hypothetical protein [Chloroflexota bacterium]